ncbi:MAG TPA: recombinase zinc beta ribbon domain-containing protein, partial [Gemmataceae bacterium]|nr:recombinase zinc beta ribbon domain-containing protein [Gemmataceae bacterium]
PTHTAKGHKRYRYYVCSAAQKRGRRSCPAGSIPAGAVERFVIDRLRCVGRDPDLVRATVEQASRQVAARIEELAAERRGLSRDLQKAHAEVRKLSGRLAEDRGGHALQQLVDLQQRIAGLEARAAVVADQVATTAKEVLRPEDVAEALGRFDGVWESLTPKEQARLVSLLVSQVDYDGTAGEVTIAFHPVGIQALVDEVAAASMGNAA